MSTKNVTKIQVPESYYHIYTRGNNKQKIFNSDADYKHFIKLLERYLSKDPVINKNGGVYPRFDNGVELLSYCFMANHFHLLIYQIDVPYLEKFMRSLMTSYSRYFNLKYKRTGPVFESRYKAALVDDDAYLQHISRYIHLNPRRWSQYKYSSLRYFRDGGAPYWLKPSRILELFKSSQEYIDFVQDYEDMSYTLDDLKHQLADS